MTPAIVDRGLVQANETSRAARAAYLLQYRFFMKINPLMAAALVSTIATVACRTDQRSSDELVHAVRSSRYLSAEMLESFPVTQQAHLLGAPGSDLMRVRALVGPNDLTLGPTNAPVVLIGFVDLSDGDGGRVVRALRDAQAAHPTDLRVVLKPVAHPDSPFSRQAAVSVVAAIAQGKGWDLALCAGELGTRGTDWRVASCAAGSGVDSTRYEQELAGASVQVDEYTDAMRTLAVTRTPTLFLNGYRINGAPPSDVLERGITLSIQEAATFAQRLGIERSQVYPAILRSASIPDSKAISAAAAIKSGMAIACLPDDATN